MCVCVCVCVCARARARARVLARVLVSGGEIWRRDRGFRERVRAGDILPPPALPIIPFPHPSTLSHTISIITTKDHSYPDSHACCWRTCVKLQEVHSDFSWRSFPYPRRVYSENWRLRKMLISTQFKAWTFSRETRSQWAAFRKRYNSPPLGYSTCAKRYGHSKNPSWRAARALRQWHAPWTPPVRACVTLTIFTSQTHKFCARHRWGIAVRAVRFHGHLPGGKMLHKSPVSTARILDPRDC